MRQRPVLRALLLGALLGAICLGAGGRIAMRMIALLEHRPLRLSIQGILTVVVWGAGFGALAGALRAGLDRIPHSRLPARLRAAAFMIVCLSLGVIVLTPLTMHRLALFPPLIALFVIVFEIVWRRNALATREQSM